MLYITPVDGKLNRASMQPGAIRSSNKALTDAYAGVVRGKPNLLAYYRLGDATASTIKDSSGNGRDISGNTGGATNPVPGSSSLLSTITDGAMSFTPNQNKEQAFSGLPSAASAWSAVCWCKPAAFGGPFSFALSYGGGGGGTNDGFGLGFTGPSGVPRFGLHNNGISVGGAATAGHIYMLGLTYDGVTAIAYLGDVTAGTITTGSLAVTMVIGTGQPIFVGNFMDGTDFFSGIIDECALWGSTLSASDMTQLFSYR